MLAVHAYNAFSTDHYALEAYMELEQLRQLQAVAEEGTISAAADALHLTQPALSRSIQRLERELGTELFRRTKNHVEFNEAGELALAAAADLTARTETLRRDLAALSRKQRTVTVASAAPAPSWRLAKLATQFMPGLILDPELAANPERADADLRITLRPPGHQLMTED
ncbi:LysR family transcriptional regulator, partial [Corynebacterium diphtheriae]